MRLYVATLVALSILAGVFIVMQAHYLAHIVNAVYLDRQGLSQVAIPLALLLLVMLARVALLLGSEVTAQSTACTVKKTLRQRLFTQFLRLGPLYAKGERNTEEPTASKRTLLAYVAGAATHCARMSSADSSSVVDDHLYLRLARLRAEANSSTCAKRCRGSFSRAFSTTHSTACEIDGTRSRNR